MGKATFTPAYISVAWALMITYQLFTQTAVLTFITFLNTFWPSTISAWLFSHVDTIIFVHAFAWVFVLSSVIPSILLGKERSVLIQFFVCLVLTLFSFWVKDALLLITDGHSIETLFSMSTLFQNPLFAGLYLSVPYLFMLLLDIRSRRLRNRKTEEIIQKVDINRSGNIDGRGENSTGI
jgi:hypothetical protein